MTGGFSWAQQFFMEMDGELSEGHQNKNISLIISCRCSANWNLSYAQWISTRQGLCEETVRALTGLLSQALSGAVVTALWTVKLFPNHAL